MSDAVASTRLAELPEEQASGELHFIYGEIKRLGGVPMVALIFRHLATIPGALEWSWSLIEPVMCDGSLQRRAWQLASAAIVARQPAIPRAALRACGIDAADERAIAAVLDAYNHANPVNIMVLRCLALHLAGEVEPIAGEPPMPPWLPPREVPPLPAMIDPQAMSREVRDLVLLLTNRHTGAADAALWPSLYRHLAHWPAMLGFASVLVLPALDAIDTVAGRLRRAIDASAVEFASRMVRPTDRVAPHGDQVTAMRAAIDLFSQRIPEMVVVGGLLRRALPLDAHIDREGRREY